jgi:hypothetical protein
MYNNELVQLTHTILSTLLHTSSSCCRAVDPSLEAFLFPYLYENMRSNLGNISYYLTAHNDASDTTNNVNNKQLTAFVRANMSSDAACSHAIKTLATYTSKSISKDDVEACNIMYRRLKASRLQALVTLVLDTNHPSTKFDFIYESNSISTDHKGCWRLRFFTFAELDETEYYWRPWCPSLADAELDYEQEKTTSFRTNLEFLQVDDFDFLSSSRSSRSSSISEWSLNTSQNLHIHEERSFTTTIHSDDNNDFTLKPATTNHVLIRNGPTTNIWANNDSVYVAADNGYVDEEDSYWDRYDDQY